jgi:hypothetical protein
VLCKLACPSQSETFLTSRSGSESIGRFTRQGQHIADDLPEGLCLFAKRLEGGKFHWPRIEDLDVIPAQYRVIVAYFA